MVARAVNPRSTFTFGLTAVSTFLAGLILHRASRRIAVTMPVLLPASKVVHTSHRPPEIRPPRRSQVRTGRR